MGKLLVLVSGRCDATSCKLYCLCCRCYSWDDDPPSSAARAYQRDCSMQNQQFK